MIDEQTPLDGIDPSRSVGRARAALREASEQLEDAAAASDLPNVGVVSALSHVAAARKALGLHGSGESGGTPERAAA